MPKMNYL